MAEADLATAKREQALNPNASAYHAQQSAEKYVKAYLHHREVPFSKTHDLLFLSQLDPTLGEVLTEHEVALRTLTEYEAGSRYPPVIWLTQGQAAEAVEWSETIRDAVLRLLGAQ